MNRTKEIISSINKLSGQFAPYDIFCDWVKACALAIQNSCQMLHNHTWQEREKEYLQIAEKYGKDNMAEFVKMLAMLTETLETDMSDALGDIYMRAGLGNKNTGQFFTPYPVSVACAEMSIPKDIPDGTVTINEPSCGGGGMIIASADVLKKRGINYQKRMDVVAQDLDWKGVYMCYVQLSLLGVKATVVQGDTLQYPYPSAGRLAECIFRTPAKMGLLI